jgi:spermidine synthase
MKNNRLWLVFAVFFVSGISALIYEVVWLRILIRMLGCTVYATSTVLSAFMAGLALGSYFLGKRTDRVSRPLRLYAFLELGIGLSALLIPFLFGWLLPVYRWLYASASGPVLVLARAGLVFLLLLIPTTLMGGTLPVLSGILAREKSRFANRMGTLYGVNTLGAVCGVFASGFFLIGQIGEFNTILIGLAGNLCAGAIALVLDRKVLSFRSDPFPEAKPSSRKKIAATQISPYSDRVRRFVIAGFAVSGFVAIGYEVVWTRILQIFLRTSIYAFSMMLGIYLIGIALGSLWGRRFADRLKDPVHAFAVIELAIAFFGILGFRLLVPMDGNFYRFLFGAAGQLWVPVVLILPITICLGVLFPIVSRCFVKGEESVGRSVGQLYSLNTVGCILGSLASGFLMLPVLGTTGSILALAGINLMLGVGLFLSDGRRLRRPAALSVAAAGIIVTAMMTVRMGDIYYTIIKNRIRNELPKDGAVFFHRENVEATTTVFGSKTDPLVRSLWINGVGMTKLAVETKIMAHLPILLCENPKDALIVCFGMGTTLRSCMTHDGIRADAVELVPDTYDAFRFFHPDGPEILRNPRVRPFVDDGRNFLLMRNKRYDVITVDPPPPLSSAGTVNLYSREFVSLCSQRLAPGGVLCMWVLSGRYTELRMLMSTFRSVFPHATLWRSPQNWGFFMIGTKQPLKLPIDRFNDAFKDPKFVSDINEWDRSVPSGNAMADLLLLNESQLADFARGAPVMTDDHPYTEFFLWRWLFNPDARLRICDGETVLRWKMTESARP